MLKAIARSLAIVMILVGLLVAGGSRPATAQTPGVNLLTNGDFEAWDYGTGHWPMMWGIPEVQLCPGWQAYWVQDAPEEAPMRENWKRPEFRDVKVSEASYRVRSGNLAQKYFSFGGQHIAGIYQQVSGITPGTTLRFQVYMQTWGCMAGDQGWNICPTGHTSNSPSPFHTRVGIDPTGGNSPGAGTVIWGPEAEAYDEWRLFQVEAVAQNSTVTVFTYSHADWWDNVFRMHNDVYIDDASLIALDAPLVDIAAPPPAEPAADVVEPVEEPEPVSEAPAASEPAAPVDPPTPAPTPTPRPDGAVVHVVQPGDTLNAIALDYDVEPDQIKALNDIGDGAWLSVGQELVIAVDPAAVSIAPPDEGGAAAEPATDAATEAVAESVAEGEAAAPASTSTVAPTATSQPVAAAAQPVAANLTLPTPTPGAAAAQPEPTPTPADDTAGNAGGGRFPIVPLTLAVGVGVALGVVLNSRVKRR